MRMIGIIYLSLFMTSSLWAAVGPVQPVVSISGGHHRIDLMWEEQLNCWYEVERRSSEKDPFVKINEKYQITPRYSDFVGINELNYEYRVRAHQLKEGRGKPVASSPWSEVVRGGSFHQNIWSQITDLQRANFEFIWSFAHPASGLIRERTEYTESPKVAVWHSGCCTVGATGMGFFNIAVGVHKGWITRREAAARVLKTIMFLRDKTTRYHGAWSHWIDGETGDTIPFSEYDNGADLVETAFLAQGLIFVREFFEGTSPIEKNIRLISQELWEGIEWDFFVKQTESGPQMLWHWSPEHEFKINLPINGITECHIVHLLSMVSPKYSVGPEIYRNAWLNPKYSEHRLLDGIELDLGLGYAGPLFFTHYSYLGLDPRLLEFKDRSYLEHYGDLCEVQYRYAQRHYPKHGLHQEWGLTASNDYRGYDVHEPGHKDNGTITPTAALSSWPYAPKRAMEAYQAMYERGAELWGEYGFYDAYNDRVNWVSPGYVSIDIATIAPMIENHRSGLCWKIFSKAPEVQAMLKKVKVAEKMKP